MRRLFLKFMAPVVAGVYWLWSRTWFFTRVGKPDDGAPSVYAHWHGDELLMVGSHVRSGMAIMASLSRDGQFMGRVLRGLGYRIVHGSSSRGGAAALRALIDTAREHQCDSGLAVDGPRGPIYVVKPGILKLAQRTGIRLVPAASAANWRFVFRNAWNRAYLPLPFARCTILFGEPRLVPRDATPEEFERIRAELQSELWELRRKAEAKYGRELEAAAPPAPVSESIDLRPKPATGE